MSYTHQEVWQEFNVAILAVEQQFLPATQTEDTTYQENLRIVKEIIALQLNLEKQSTINLAKQIFQIRQLYKRFGEDELPTIEGEASNALVAAYCQHLKRMQDPTETVSEKLAIRKFWPAKDKLDSKILKLEQQMNDWVDSEVKSFMDLKITDLENGNVTFEEAVQEDSFQILPELFRVDDLSSLQSLRDSKTLDNLLEDLKIFASIHADLSFENNWTEQGFLAMKQQFRQAFSTIKINLEKTQKQRKQIDERDNNVTMTLQDLCLNWQWVNGILHNLESIFEPVFATKKQLLKLEEKIKITITTEGCADKQNTLSADWELLTRQVDLIRKELSVFAMSINTNLGMYAKYCENHPTVGQLHEECGKLLSTINKHQVQMLTYSKMLRKIQHHDNQHEFKTRIRRVSEEYGELSSPTNQVDDNEWTLIVSDQCPDNQYTKLTSEQIDTQQQNQGDHCGVTKFFSTRITVL